MIEVDTFLGSGDGTFQSPATSYFDQLYVIPKEELYGVEAVKNGFPGTGKSALADFNGDGNLDIAIPEPHNCTLVVLQGDGSGGFKSYPAGIIQAAGAGTYGPGEVIAADLNGDGHVDLVVLTQGLDVTEPLDPQPVLVPGTLSVYLGTGNGSFQSPMPVSPNVQSVLVADANNDGIADLITTQSDYGLQVFVGVGDGKFNAHPEMPSTNGAQAWLIGFKDWNNDGIPDIALVGPNGVSLMLGKDNLTYSAPIAYPAGGLQLSNGPGYRLF